MNLYLRYIAVSIRSQLQYRASVIMQTIGVLLVTAIEFIAIVALFARFGQIRGWSLPEVALFYGMISISWSLCDAMGRGFEVFGSIIKSGDFDRMLVRPRSTILQILGYELTLRRSGRLAQGIAVLAYSITSLDLAWTAVPLIALGVVSTICTFLGLLVLQATSCFWTTDTLEVWNAFTYGGVTMSQYPLPIYRSWFVKFFTFAIPIGCGNYLPGIAALGRHDPLGTSQIVQWLAPLAGPVFLGVALVAFRFGTRYYRSTGS